jgi:hypothetical protein
VTTLRRGDQPGCVRLPRPYGPGSSRDDRAARPRAAAAGARGDAGPHSLQATHRVETFRYGLDLVDDTLKCTLRAVGFNLQPLDNPVTLCSN